MPNSLDELLNNLTSEDKSQRDSAAYILMLLLEIVANEHCESLVASNRELLPDDFKLVVLTEQDQQKVIEKIYVALRHVYQGERASLIHIISKGAPELVFEPLVKAIHEFSDNFGDEEAAQAIFGLYHLVCCDPTTSLFLKHVDLLRQSNTESFVSKWNIEPVNSRFDVKAVIAHIHKAVGP
jgi:hypothetical protein